jgi:flagellar biosynthesis/type III secretory pathway M-ring protein FliF/YscJ
MTLLVVFLIVVLILAVLLVIPRRSSATSQSSAVEDEEELTRAEEDVADLNAMITPEEATEELPDWGPGVPKPRRGPS